jgi:hypothetical protein
MIDRSILNVIESAKAYAALVAGLLTLFLSSGVVADVPSWLPAVVVFLGAFAVWKIPNGTPAGGDINDVDGNGDTNIGDH